MTESNRYVVTAGLAATLGIVGTLTTAGLTEKQGRRIDRSYSHTKNPGEISGAQTQINNFATNNACPAIIDAGAPSCTSDDVFQMRFGRSILNSEGDFIGRVEAEVLGVNYQGETDPLTSGQRNQLRNFLVNNFCTELQADALVSTCAGSDFMSATFLRADPSRPEDGWYARAEAVWRYTVSEGAPDT